MSFDVSFWRYSESLDHDHVAIQAALAKSEQVDGVDVVDTDAMVDRLAELLSAWDRVEDRTWEKPGQYLQAWTTPQYLSINMSFRASRAVLLRITTPMRRFGCGLWNPQMNVRLPGYDEAGAKGEK